MRKGLSTEGGLAGELGSVLKSTESLPEGE